MITIWEKMYIQAGKNTTNKPTANITKSMALCFNRFSTQILIDAGCKGFVDIYKNGEKFALKKGSSFFVSFGKKFNKTEQHYTQSAKISSKYLGEFLKAQSHSNLFSVYRDGEFVVLEPVKEMTT